MDKAIIKCPKCKKIYDCMNWYLCPKCGKDNDIYNEYLYRQFGTNIYYEKNKLEYSVCDYIKFFDDLFKKTEDLINEILNKKTNNNDFCIDVLQQFQIIIAKAIYNLKFYLRDLKSNDKIFEVFTKYHNKWDNETLNIILGNINVYIKTSFLYIGQSKIEMLFNELAKKYKCYKKDKYPDTICCLFDELSIDKKFINYLLLVNEVRNIQLHHNNLYQGKYKYYNVKGIHFGFINNKNPQYLSWRHLVFYFDNILYVLKIVLNKHNIHNKSTK